MRIFKAAESITFLELQSNLWRKGTPGSYRTRGNFNVFPFSFALPHEVSVTRRGENKPQTYRLLRRLGFDGIAITDSLYLVHDAPIERWARQAARAGADMLLFTSPAHARRAIRALVPLARRGELDGHVARILAFRRMLEAPS